MKLNEAKPKVAKAVTFEGGRARSFSPEFELRRAVLSCLLWENQFYESGKNIADRIAESCLKVSPQFVADLAIEARSSFHLRHVPLLLLARLVSTHGTGLTADAICKVIQRPDEMCELLAIYWKDGRRPLTRPLKSGLAAAFRKFTPHQLAKYHGKKNGISLRDVMFLVHPKPESEEQAAAWRKLANGELNSAETWEVMLSGGGDKKATFERLISEGKLGYLALLRNLRNMTEAGCDQTLIRNAILSRKGGADKVLPFRFVAAARACPSMEPHLDTALIGAIAGLPRLAGHTICLVDVSGSMDAKLSGKSDLSRMDAAAALASVLNCDSLQVLTFSDDVVEVAPRRGMAGVDAIVRSQFHSGTRLGDAVRFANAIPHDRLIVISDEQTSDFVPAPKAGKAYMINVASHSRGVGYGDWTRIDGFSESVIRFIAETETQR